MSQEISIWTQREDVARAHRVQLKSNMSGVGEDNPAIKEMSAKFGLSPQGVISGIEADYTQLAGLNSL